MDSNQREIQSFRSQLCSALGENAEEVLKNAPTGKCSPHIVFRESEIEG